MECQDQRQHPSSGSHQRGTMSWIVLLGFRSVKKLSQAILNVVIYDSLLNSRHFLARMDSYATRREATNDRYLYDTKKTALKAKYPVICDLGDSPECTIKRLHRRKHWCYLHKAKQPATWMKFRWPIGLILQCSIRTVQIRWKSLPSSEEPRECPWRSDRAQ